MKILILNNLWIYLKSKKYIQISVLVEDLKSIFLKRLGNLVWL